MVRSAIASWHRKNPEKLKELKAALGHEFPDLWVSVVDNKVCIRGSFPVTANGSILDRYLIRVEISRDYPVSPPEVFEIGNRIPRTADHHMSEEGRACVFLPDEAWKYYSPAMSIVDFLRGPVNDFFLFQKESELLHHSLVEARRHGVQGIIDYYREELHTDDLEVIIKFVDYLSRETKKEPRGHWDCFCGSGKKMRDCHFDKLLEMRKKIKPAVATVSLDRLLRHKRGEPNVLIAK
jgi:hypothetical protein